MTGPSACSTSSSSTAKVTAEGNFAEMCTLLGGFDDSCFRGYVGTWTAFDMQHHPGSPGAPPSSGQAANTSTLQPSHQAAASEAASATASSAAAAVVPVFVGETVNFRLFRLEDAAAHRIHQVNMYQGGGRPAAASYKTYLTSDAAPEGRPDGYGLREWRHDPSGALWNPDGSAWRGDPSTAEKTLLGLAVGDCGLALINGALPSSFTPQHTPTSWWMEAIFKQPGSHARRWGMLHRFDAGRLANSKAINEDLTEIRTQILHSCSIDPAAIKWQDRNQGSLGDLDALFANTQQVNSNSSSVQLRLNPTGTATTFTYDAQHQLTRQTGPCEWSSSHVAAMDAAAAAAAEAAGSGASKLPAATAAVVQVDLPDWSYSRLPADMAALVSATAAGTGTPEAAASAAAAGKTSLQDAGSGAAAQVVFELGTLLLDGSLARWLLAYDAGGGRLLQRATYELYPPGG